MEGRGGLCRALEAIVCLEALLSEMEKFQGGCIGE